MLILCDETLLVPAEEGFAMFWLGFLGIELGILSKKENRYE